MTVLPGSDPPSTCRRLALAAVLTATSLVVLDAGMVNVALPTMAHSLGATPAMAVLIVTAYQTAIVMALLPCAAMGEWLGYRRVFVGGVVLFACASAFSAVAPSLAYLVAARFLQGLGGAAVMALGVALLRFSVPSGKLAAAISWNALTVALATAASPALGALILAGTSWHWLFLVNIPLSALALLAASCLPRVIGNGKPVDALSVTLNGITFGALVLAAEVLVRNPGLAFLLIVASGSALMALILRESRKSVPMIPIDLLRGRVFRIAVIASVCCFAGQTAGLVALTFYLQHTLGQTPLMVGAFMTPWPLSVAASALIAGRLSGRVPTAWLCAMGGGCLALGLAATALWPPQADPRLIVVFAVLCGLGFGLFQTPNNRAMFLSAPRERSGAAGGMQGTARLTGQTAGAVLMTLLFTLTPIAVAPRIGLGVGAAFALMAGLVSTFRLPTDKASPNAPS